MCLLVKSVVIRFHIRILCTFDWRSEIFRFEFAQVIVDSVCLLFGLIDDDDIRRTYSLVLVNNHFLELMFLSSSFFPFFLIKKICIFALEETKRKSELELYVSFCIAFHSYYKPAEVFRRWLSVFFFVSLVCYNFNFELEFKCFSFLRLSQTRESAMTGWYSHSHFIPYLVTKYSYCDHFSKYMSTTVFSIIEQI